MSIGMGEVILILVVVLLIFGAAKLPEIGKALGKGIKGVGLLNNLTFPY